MRISSPQGLAPVYRLEDNSNGGAVTLLSHILRSGIRDHQLVHHTGPLVMFSSRALGIETGLHYRRDVTFKEDATRMTIGNTGKVMASINNLAIALIY